MISSIANGPRINSGTSCNLATHERPWTGFATNVTLMKSQSLGCNIRLSQALYTCYITIHATFMYRSVLARIAMKYKKNKEREKNCACQVWPRALRKGHLKGRTPPHRPRRRGGTDVYTSKLASTMGPTTRHEV
eukprot:1141553-Pelagomonas_calceolata.AAC.1